MPPPSHLAFSVVVVLHTPKTFFFFNPADLFFPLWISSRVQLPWCLAFWLAAQALPKSPLGRRSWPLRSTTDWWNKRPAQGAQITLHPCLSYPKCLWRAREDADDPASRAALNSVLQTPFKPPSLFQLRCRFWKFYTSLVYNGPHSSQQVKNTVCWHLKRFSRHSSALTCLWTVPSLLRALLLGDKRSLWEEKLWHATRRLAVNDSVFHWCTDNGINIPLACGHLLQTCHWKLFICLGHGN